MKKRVVLVMLALSLVCIVGCGKENKTVDEAIMEVSEEANPIKSEEANSQEEVAVKSDSAEKTDNNENVEENAEELLERVSDENIKSILDEMLTWAGTKYFYDPVTEFSQLDDTTRIDMAAFACEMNSNEDDGIPEHTDDWRLIIPNDKLEAKMKALFGSSYDEKAYIPYNNSYVSVVDGVLSISQGDWGLVVPTAEYKVIYEENSNSFVIEAQYTAYDFMEDVNVTEYDYFMTYECELSAESENGFIINSITSENRGEYPVKFDPASIAGVYASEWSDEIEGEEVKYVSYLALAEDGTGTWLVQDSVPIAFDGYDIFVGAEDNPMPYSYYEGEITIYPDDDIYEHYIKIDMTMEEFQALLDNI